MLMMWLKLVQASAPRRQLRSHSSLSATCLATQYRETNNHVICNILNFWLSNFKRFCSKFVKLKLDDVFELDKCSPAGVDSVGGVAVRGREIAGLAKVET